jgi:hypothetical protein
MYEKRKNGQMSPPGYSKIDKKAKLNMMEDDRDGNQDTDPEELDVVGSLAKKKQPKNSLNKKNSLSSDRKRGNTWGVLDSQQSKMFN